jgi:hypothetical protein
VLKPIAFISKRFVGAEVNYSTIEKECLSIVFTLKKFSVYLIAKPFEIQTDHRNLIYLNSTPYSCQRVARWAMLIQQYKFIITYIAGTTNVVSDYLSRYINPKETIVEELPIQSQ